MTMHTPTLSGKSNFERIFQEGRSLVSRELVLYFMTNQQKGDRVAFCVGKSIGCAVQRNQTKRRLREAFRLLEEHLIPGYTLAWVARNKVKDLSYPDLCKNMTRLLKKAGILSEESVHNND